MVLINYIKRLSSNSAVKKISLLLAALGLTVSFILGCAPRYGKYEPENKEALRTLAGGAIGAIAAWNAGGAIVGAFVADIYNISFVKYEDRRLEDTDEASRKKDNGIREAERKREEEQKAEREGPVEQKAEKERPVEQKAEKEKPVEQKAEKEKPVEQKAEKEKPIEQKAEKERPVEQKAEKERPIEQKAEKERPIEQKAEKERPIEQKAEKERPIEQKAEKERPIEQKAEKERPIEQKAEKERPIEQKAEKERPVEQKAEKERPVEQKAEKERPIEQKAEKERPVEQRAEKDIVERAKFSIEEFMVSSQTARPGSPMEAKVQYTVQPPKDEKEVRLTEKRIFFAADKRIELDSREIYRTEGRYLSIIKFNVPEELPRGYCILYTILSDGKRSKTERTVINII